MTLREIFFRSISIGEQADVIANVLDKSRVGIVARDLALAVEHSAKALSKSTLQRIAHSN
jgi:hypothetical protein